MKKFAYIIMGPGYDPDTQRALFETPGGLTAIFTVRNFAEAKTRLLKCRDEGFGVVELCGAFGEERARELIELTENKLGIGFVVHLATQNKLFDSFFSKD